ncbi:MAG TPA: hypothetical protein VGM89_15525 [Puia sp.]|jgi:hypothetical protein
MYFPFIHLFQHSEPSEDHSLAITPRQMDYTNEGSESLDDAIRTDDVPQGRTEESIAPGSPGNLLLGEVVSDLEQKGYCADLNFETDPFCLYGGDLDMRLNPDAFHVDEIDRIGSESQPNDGAVVYAISTSSGEKGIIINH